MCEKRADGPVPERMVLSAAIASGPSWPAYHCPTNWNAPQ